MHKLTHPKSTHTRVRTHADCPVANANSGTELVARMLVRGLGVLRVAGGVCSFAPSVCIFTGSARDSALGAGFPSFSLT